jgi:hypothetical protein
MICAIMNALRYGWLCYAVVAVCVALAVGIRVKNALEGTK